MSVGGQPVFSETQAVDIANKLFGIVASKISSLPSYDDQNWRIYVDDQQQQQQYVLKISHSDTCYGSLPYQTLCTVAMRC
jgi:hypothetical protein